MKDDVLSHIKQNAHRKVNAWSTCAAAARSALASWPMLTWTSMLIHDAPLSLRRQYGVLWGRGVHTLVHPQFFRQFSVREQCTAHLSVYELWNTLWVTGVKVSAAGTPSSAFFFSHHFPGGCLTILTFTSLLSNGCGEERPGRWCEQEWGCRSLDHCRPRRRAKISEDSTKARIDPGSGWWWNLPPPLSSDPHACWGLLREEERLKGAA